MTIINDTAIETTALQAPLDSFQALQGLTLQALSDIAAFNDACSLVDLAEAEQEGREITDAEWSAHRAASDQQAASVVALLDHRPACVGELAAKVAVLLLPAIAREVQAAEWLHVYQADALALVARQSANRITQASAAPDGFTPPTELAQTYLLGLAATDGFDNEAESLAAFEMATAAYGALEAAPIHSREDAAAKLVAARRRLALENENLGALTMVDQVAEYLE